MADPVDPHLELIDLDPARTVGPPSARETHISVVFLAGARAWKLCKPVNVGFLDMRRREDRYAVLRRELDLNRRFAPDVYLGMMELVDELGMVIDHALVMRRLPDESRLATLVAPGGAPRATVLSLVRDVARRVAVIHGAAPRPAEALAAATPEALANNWASNVAVLATASVDTQTLHRIELLVAEYLRGREPLFVDRARRGLVIDGHGDLLADDIFCLDDGPRILDCLAFDDRFRFGDVLLDAAFLAMDLERLADAELSGRFLDWYSEFSGERHPPSLAHHFQAYRASVRAKVACLRARQGQPAAAVERDRYVAQCLDHLERARVRLVLVGGPPGTGKTTLANAIGDATGWTVLHSDELRKDLAGVPYDLASASSLDTALYAEDRRDATYAEFIREAVTLGGAGHSVVLDATWAGASHREKLRTAAKKASIEVVELSLTVPVELARERIAERRRSHPDASDATPELVGELTARFEAWPEATQFDGGIDAVRVCQPELLGAW